MHEVVPLKGRQSPIHGLKVKVQTLGNSGKQELTFNRKWKNQTRGEAPLPRPVGANGRKTGQQRDRGRQPETNNN